MKAFLSQLFKDKNGNFSLREFATALFLLVITVSWAAEQFFHLHMPEYMFYTFATMIGTGCFGYSIERKTIKNEKDENQ
ncbi:MAG: hypothetical protein J0G98_04410 [Terrimonas ferruginea]|uniref:hypothetical protein n=1 Tax=Terrimonas ferruginea TaxID=249 RepID=UPI00092AE1B3|nr:hypothetical protein [Terrimonas ferruginea]MBN8782286.1 hypothetical protein [Terrimonas ferruginea]OJW42809.1 MAG: hypothetical protein BGO56_12275 [Sphingobacteriales bacterium 48-107]